MNILPATNPAPGTATDADRAWACDYLAAVLGRPVSGGLNVDRLAAKLASERATEPLAVVPAPRAAWRDVPVRGGLQR